MSTEKRGLGRGLSALIPPSGAPARAQPAVDADETGMVLAVPITDIVPNPRQPRAAVAPETLSDLAASIREHGIIQPLIVTRLQAPTEAAPYQLIAGERRWRAAQVAGLSTVPVLVKEATPQQHLELALVENLQRADLNPLEEADAYQALMSEFGVSQQEVADRVGKSRVAVTNSVRLLRLPDPVKALLTGGSVTEGHARALLALTDDEIIVRAAEQVVARELTVRQTEELVRRLAAGGKPATEGLRLLDQRERGSPDAQVDSVGEEGSGLIQTRQLEEGFRSALGTKVALTRGRRGGRLVISFYSDEELQAIYERIVGPAR